MNNGSKYSRLFVILGVVLLTAGVLLAVANFANFSFDNIFNGGRIFSSVSGHNNAGSYNKAGGRNNVDEERTEAINSINAISVETISDNINLIPVDSDEVKAHYYGSYSSTNPDYKPELVVEKNGSQLKIRIDYESNIMHFSFRSDLKLDVYIPRQFKENLEVISTSGEVTVGALNVEKFDYVNTSGDLNTEKIQVKKASLSTTSGEAKISGEFESFRFSTTSGDLVSDDFSSKESTLNTTSGEIKLSGQPGDVTSKGVSGNLNLGYTDFDNTIEANTVSGEVEIRLPADAGFKLDYSTVSGDTHCDFDVSGSKGEHDLKGTVGSGDGSVRVHTASGDLAIKN